MIGHHYFILGADGEPEPVEDVVTWGRWFERASDSGERVVAKTEVGDAEVSSVFIGLNHDFSGNLPMLFETMIFGGQWDSYLWRYTMRVEARAGHDAIVAALRAGQPPPDL